MRSWIYGKLICPVSYAVILSRNTLSAFENGVLRTVFGPRSKEMTGSKKNLHNGEPHNLYASPNTLKMIESRKVRWVGNAWEMSNAYNIGLVKCEEKMPYWLGVLVKVKLDSEETSFEFKDGGPMSTQWWWTMNSGNTLKQLSEY